MRYMELRVLHHFFLPYAVCTYLYVYVYLSVNECVYTYV
jgi:hypothetical protein